MINHDARSGGDHGAVIIYASCHEQNEKGAITLVKPVISPGGPIRGWKVYPPPLATWKTAGGTIGFDGILFLGASPPP